MTQSALVGLAPGRIRRAVEVAMPCALLAACAARAPRPAEPPAAGLRVAAGANRCLTALPASALTARDTVYVHAVVPESGLQILWPEADRLAERVGAAIRQLLGGGPDSLPAGEPTLTWLNDLDGHLTVVLRRDGRATWRQTPPADSADSLPTALLAGAMGVVAQRAPVTWPPSVGRDSVTIELSLGLVRWRLARAEGSTGRGYLVTVLRAPPETRPRLLWHMPLHYPMLPDGQALGAHLIIEAIVDTTGRVERGSVHDHWPPNVPRYTGLQQAEYENFVNEARANIQGARFAPGRIAGCAVRVRVQIPVNFTRREGAAP
jgi:hypothetical protein